MWVSVDGREKNPATFQMLKQTALNWFFSSHTLVVWDALWRGCAEVHIVEPYKDGVHKTLLVGGSTHRGILRANRCIAVGTRSNHGFRVS